MSVYSKQDLKGLEPQHDWFVGIDSDGCVFDTMEIKQKQCFHPQIIRHWGLERIERYVREAAEFVNLYSKWRGINRFPALVRVFDLLRQRPEVQQAGVEIPALNSLRRYIESGLPLSNETLREQARRSGDAELHSVLEWSLAVNASIKQTVKNVPPFRWVRDSLQKMAAQADLIVVSQTPEEALLREWKEHGIDGYARLIAGQELGTKGEHLQMASGGKYDPDHILMIGDAPGDRKAAAAVAACFFPVNPGREERSWQRLYEEAFDRFLSGQFRGRYERQLHNQFEALLPERPPWQTSTPAAGRSTIDQTTTGVN